MSPGSMQAFAIRYWPTSFVSVLNILADRVQVLTNHGHDQANRLGDHLAKAAIVLTHIFASPLTRTSKTAEAIRQSQVATYPDTASSALEIVKVPELIEQVCSVCDSDGHTLIVNRISGIMKANLSNLGLRIRRRPDAKHIATNIKMMKASLMLKARTRWQSGPIISWTTICYLCSTLTRPPTNIQWR